MAGGSGYSRFVRLLRIGLPLIAIALIATVFLVSKQLDLDRPVRIRGIDVQELLRQSGMGSPEFVGHTRDGATLKLTAARAFPRTEDDTLSAREVTVEIIGDSGRDLLLTAPSAEIPQGSTSAQFTGGVHVETAEGIVMDTERLDVAQDMSELVAPGPVTARAPFGTIEAGNMRATRSESDSGAGYLTLFEGGVRVIYDPSQAK